jgi:hypothetical protein
MIIKCKSIAHIEESLKYIEKEEKDHEFFDSYGVDTSSIRTILNDFSMFDSEKVKNKYVSLVISPNKLDNLNDKQLKETLQRTLMELGLTNRSYYSVKHRNTDNTHLHVYLCRISHDGVTWNDSRTAKRSMEAGLKITQEMNLLPYEIDSFWAKNDRSINSKYSKEKKEAISELKSIVEKNLYKVISVDELFDKLESKGAVVSINELKNGSLGVNIHYQDLNIKASEVSRYLTVKNEDGFYTANKKLQDVIDRNILRFEMKRDAQSIEMDIQKYPDRFFEFQQELREHYIFILDFYRGKDTTWEEELQNRLRKKYSYTKKVIFRI